MKQIVINGDNIALLKNYPDNYFNAVVTDPPYGLGKEPNAEEVIIFNHNIKISEWLEMMKYKDISMRLYNCLYSFSCHNLRDIRINDIEKMDILSKKNAGKKCWEEFQKLREEYNQSIKK